MIQAGSHPTRLIIYGAGGHGLVIAESAEAAGFHVMGFIDDSPNQSTITRWPIFKAGEHQEEPATYIVAIGDNEQRHAAIQKLVDRGMKIETVIHPSAHISGSAMIGNGVFIGPHAVIHSESHIDDGAIINSGSVIEHHCHIGACTHLAPGSVLGGGAQIGRFTLVGLNATVLPRISIGSHCTIGAGAVVRKNTSDHQTIV